MKEKQKPRAFQRRQKGKMQGCEKDREVKKKVHVSDDGKDASGRVNLQ